mmetsp:Transcript_33852/g.74291  ORF Transcript_33852/g.74291 Transcript_33852/m.74291 type:complete len:275 (+) Transcript_33852:605-1429(+)
MPARRLSRDDNVVNLEYEADALGGEADGGGVDEERHEHVLFEDVGDAPLAHVDARRRLARRVPVAQIRHHLDGVEAGVLGERVRHHLHGLGKGLDAVGVRARQRIGPLGQLVRKLHLGSAAAGREEALLHEAAQHAERVVQRARALLQDQVVRRLAQDGHRLAAVWHACHLDHLAVAGGHLLDHVGLAQLLSVQRVGVGDGHTAARLADELNVVALNVLDHQDLHLGQKVERELVHRVAQDGLLDEDDVCAALLDLLAQVEDVLALLFEDAVHL